jgi:hypothetical protein
MGTTAEDICRFYETEGAIRAKGKRFTIVLLRRQPSVAAGCLNVRLLLEAR